MHSPASSPARRLFLALALLASAALALPALVHAQTRYSVTFMGTNFNFGSVAYGMNASGAVVGIDFTTTGIRPFIYANGAVSVLPSLQLGADVPSGINAAGTVVGTSRSASAARGFVVTNGVVTDLGADVIPVAISDDGFIAGTTGGRGFIRSPAGVVTLFGPTGAGEGAVVNGISPSGGIVVGSARTAGVTRAFRYANGVLTDLTFVPGESSSAAYGINAAGVIVGSSTAAGSTRAVVFSNGTGTVIPTPPGNSVAYGINAAGAVVGDYSGTGRAGPFLYTPAAGFVDLTPLVLNAAAAGFSTLSNTNSQTVRAINDAGQILGTAVLPMTGSNTGYRLDPVAGPAVAPAITTHPAAQTVAAGGTATFSVVATGSPTPSYEWRFNTTPIAGATAQTYSLAAVTAANAGSYTVRVFNTAGTVTSNAATLTVTAAPPPPVAGRLINLSILTSLAGASDSFTMGYVVGGRDTSGTKPLVIRAAGPALTALGVGGALADPKLELFVGSTKSGENDNWGGSATLLAAMNAVGAFPFTPTGAPSLDAAVAVSVAAGDNSVKVMPVGNLSGAVIAEIYDATPTANFTATTPRLINVSVLKKHRHEPDRGLRHRRRHDPAHRADPRHRAGARYIRPHRVRRRPAARALQFRLRENRRERQLGRHRRAHRRVCAGHLRAAPCLARCRARRDAPARQLHRPGQRRRRHDGHGPRRDLRAAVRRGSERLKTKKPDAFVGVFCWRDISRREVKRAQTFGPPCARLRARRRRPFSRMKPGRVGLVIPALHAFHRRDVHRRRASISTSGRT